MIPFYRPYYNHRELVAALRPGRARCELESTVAARVGARYGVAFAYGRVVLMAALQALGVSQAEVILPAYTCMVMGHAIVASGNRPVFVDIDLADYNMDIDALSQALTSQTRAVVATHMYGYLTDVDAIRAAVGDERVIIVEDCAQSLHALSEGGELRGDLGLFSFGPGKPISTFEGGILVTNSPDVYEKIKTYRDAEMNGPAFKARAKRWARFLSSYLMFRPGIYGLWHRDQTDPTHVAHPEFDLPADYMPDDITMAYPDFQARVGLVQLRKVDAMLNRRRALAELYDRELRDVSGLVRAPIIPDATYAYYTLRLDRRQERCFRRRMLAQAVAVDQVFEYVLPLLKAYRPYATGEYPRAEQASREVVNLPLYPGLSETDVRYIAGCTRRALEEDLDL
jgi:perosamine synthetase